MNKKRQLQKQADILWYKLLLKSNCEVCGRPSNQVHHFFPKNSYGHLRYNLDNGISICKSCHFKHHNKYMPEIQQTIVKFRGQKWYDNLEKISKKREISFKTIKYYEDIIKKLSTLTQIKIKSKINIYDNKNI